MTPEIGSEWGKGKKSEKKEEKAEGKGIAEDWGSC